MTTTLRLLVLCLAACASAPRSEPAAAPTSPGAAAPASAQAASSGAPARAPSGPQESLASYAPESAMGVLVVRARALGLLRDYFAANPELQKELSEHFTTTLGIDLTRVEGVVVHLTTISPPSGALLLRLPPEPGPLKLKPIGAIDGVPLYKLSEYVAARVPAGIVIGTHAGVLEQIQLGKGARKPLDPAGPLARALGDPNTIDTALAVDGTRMPELGIERGAITIGDGGLIALTLTGDPARLQQMRGLFALGTQKMLSELEAGRARARNRTDPFEGAAAIAAFYSAQKTVHELEPKLVGNQLVSEYRIPRYDTHAALVPFVGMLAAIAIPSFTKYIHKSKATEAQMQLRRLKTAALSYRAEHEGKKFAFPASTGWTPAAGCCAGPDKKCTPEPKAWSAPTWRALDFSMESPHYYQYRFVSEGRGPSAHFTIEARGDLDCDGEFATFRLKDTASEIESEHPDE